MEEAAGEQEEEEGDPAVVLRQETFACVVFPNNIDLVKMQDFGLGGRLPGPGGVPPVRPRPEVVLILSRVRGGGSGGSSKVKEGFTSNFLYILEKNCNLEIALQFYLQTHLRFFPSPVTKTVFSLSLQLFRSGLGHLRPASSGRPRAPPRPPAEDPPRAGGAQEEQRREEDLGGDRGGL